ncbi:MAG: DUF378 domain-containing protein [Chloroflexota bacterium]|nr:DUF378 domain-containing protein [Chloroflexota bacterium]
MGKRLDLLALPLVVVGALNWGFVGLFEFDLVAKLVGEEFGQVNLVSRIVYVLVALAGIALIPARARVAQQTVEAHKSYA